ncbi:helix-turn-helix domain-containing protein [Paraburkholderia acidisoli]|uniref:Helix-turn-helix domain-containing protein n=2 Tax=Paraburkholderia acidisoli TaxID=2571748 RepID=A0A7Z2JHI0_9BURK|nr:helix-turn-helix domain-containing protein [Paraburkholderia acidisoli]
MHIHANSIRPTLPRTRIRPIVEATFVDECLKDAPRMMMPRPELHIAVRFGPSAQRGLDIHVLGPRQHVTRKTVREGQWTILARLTLAHTRSVLGAPPAAFTEHIVPLEQVWSASDARSLYDELLKAASPTDAATILEQTISARLPLDHLQGEPAALAFEAARRLLDANVSAVAAELNISARHLRRVFLDTTGMSPKRFARLMRFSRAADLARDNSRRTWASIAAAAGYYDQAHLIEDFHAFAGTTPEAFRRELGNTDVLRRLDGTARA